MTTQKRGVRTEHPDYVRMAASWDRCRHAAEGERKIHEKGVVYLPKLAAETDTDYNARKARTPFFNATSRTISGLKGMMFRKAPMVEVPAAIEPFLADIDMAGTPLDLFTQRVSQDVLTDWAGIMVDRPPMPEGEAITQARAEQIGLRPMLLRYPAVSVINWKTARVNNALVLTLVVLQESAALEGEEFEHKTETRYRVLDLVPGEAGMVYRQRVFAVHDEKDVQIGKDIFPAMNGKTMSFIPFWFIGVDGMEATPPVPPLLDLVDMNIHHYQVSADYEHGCHFSGLPTLFISGYMPEEGKVIYLGSPAANALPDPQAQAYYAEVDGDFGALRANLDAKKDEMAVLGARMLETQKKTVESADTQKQRVAGEQCQLAAMAQVLSMAMTKALTVFAEWAGATGKVVFEVNRDFIPVGMTAEDLNALVTSWQAGAISRQVLHENLQRGEIVSQDTTVEEEQERIASAPPVLTSEDDGQETE
jgi:hypothetical protein